MLRFDRRVADVGVDLDLRDGADGHRLELPGEVVHVRRDDQTPARDLVADKVRGEVFAFGNALHGGGNDALAGEEHLSDRFHGSLRRS